MKDRIKAVRNAVGKTQEDFAEKIGIGKSSVSLLESGRNNPSEQTIRAICKEFGVNENWLRNGEGEMFRTLNREDELSYMMSKMLKCEPSFKHRLISVLLRMSEGEWEMLERKAIELVEEMKKADP